MSARPPPARPHIAIHPSTYSTGSSWVEDDAWDSASDEEDTPKPSSSRVPPRPVPRPVPQASSSSTLAFSYTHVSAPNPSSYPPREIPPKNGWTIVKTKSGESASTNPKPDDELEPNGDGDGDGDADVENEMILGDLEPDAMEAMDIIPSLNSKQKSDQGRVRDDVDAIVDDPLCAVRHRARRTEPEEPKRPSRSTSPESAERSEKLMRERSIRTNRRHKFVECLSGQDVNIAELRKLAWAGIPADLRPMAWQLLLGYLPLPTPLRASTLARKRGEYLSLVELAFARDREGLDQQIWHQIEIDVPRTRPGVHLWMQAATQRALERILYVWAIRHPASGYVQGINDLATPFFQVFLSAYIDSDPELFDPAALPARALDAVEADSFWCLSRLLDGIQDNYIFAQPGIQRSVRRMAELVARIDKPLAAHLDAQNVEFMQFAFRWMNCLLMREISVRNTVRMWDTYLAEGPDAFSQFHLYVCSAFLVKWSDKLRQMDFQVCSVFPSSSVLCGVVFKRHSPSLLIPPSPASIYITNSHAGHNHVPA
ncbi:rab-GTPase-TBC domain-containing protein, partial [Mycena crocata]